MFIAPIVLLSAVAAALAVPVLDGASMPQKRSFTKPPKELIEALQQATSPNERYAILPPDYFSFSFLDTPYFGGGGKDGGVVLGNDELWPGVIGHGIAMLMGFLGPCGMVAPHSHPRASEIYLNIAGPPLMAGIIPENGAPLIMSTAGPGNATILPRGSVHYIANTGCEPTVIVAGFNAENPGVLFVSTSYAAFDSETYSAAFGGIGVTMLDPAKIPNTVILGRESCLKKCGIDRATFDINSVGNKAMMLQAYAGYLKSQGYTVTGGAGGAQASSSVAGGAPATTSVAGGAPATTSARAGSSTPASSPSTAGGVKAGINNSDNDSSDTSNNYRVAFIALVCIVSLQSVVMLGALLWFCCIKRKGRAVVNGADHTRTWVSWTPSIYGYAKPGEKTAPLGVPEDPDVYGHK